MKRKVIASFAFILVVSFASFLIINRSHVKKEENELFEENEENEAAYQYLRWKYEADMIKDPTTGEALFGLRDHEIDFARTIPERTSSSSTSRLTIQNNYLPAGPNNVGGRTRAIAYDVRYNSSSNKVIIAGCVSGGIMRSADGGATWTLVTPANEIHSFTAIAQDPRAGSQNTWYAGGGEFSGNSATAPGAPYLGYGIWKSVDNGVTWTRQTLTVTDIGGTLLDAG